MDGKKREKKINSHKFARRELTKPNENRRGTH